jgi:hypothetical protein
MFVIAKELLLLDNRYDMIVALQKANVKRNLRSETFPS